MSFTPDTLRRQWQTLRLIPRHPRRITATDLHQKLTDEGISVGKRTIERDLQSLAYIFPITSDERSKPFGWSWQKDAASFDLPGLTNSQAITLLLAREHLSTLLPVSALTQLHGFFELAEQTIDANEGQVGIASWMNKVRVIPPTQPLLSPQVNESMQSVLHESLIFNKQCLVIYQSREQPTADNYPVHPLGIVQRGQILYLVCSIKNYPDVRLLALHRIQYAEMLDASVITPNGFNLDAYIESDALGWFPKDSIQLEAFFNADIAIHLAETPLAIGQALQKMPDGRVRLTVTVRETMQLRWWLQGFGPGVEVVSPITLRNQISDAAHQMVQLYRTSDAIESQTL